MGGNKNCHFNKTWERLQRQAPRRLLLELGLFLPPEITLQHQPWLCCPAWPGIRAGHSCTEQVRREAAPLVGNSDLSFAL